MKRMMALSIVINYALSGPTSIRGKRFDSLCSKKTTTYHCVATTCAKECHVLLRAMHVFEIHNKSRQAVFLEGVQKKRRHCEGGLS